MPHHHYHIFSHLLRDKLRAIYMNISLQSFAMSMVSIFVPIYLLKLGYSLNQTLFYVLLEWLSFGLFAPISAWLSSKFGFKHILLFRLPLTITSLLLLSFIESISISIYFVAVLIGISGSMYVIPLNNLFVKYSNYNYVCI